MTKKEKAQYFKASAKRKDVIMAKFRQVAVPGMYSDTAVDIIVDEGADLLTKYIDEEILDSFVKDL